MTGDQCLVPSTVRIQFTLNNGEALKLRPVSGPWSFFRRMRILAQGQVVEDIDNYARTQEMFQVLTSRHNRGNDDISGFGYRYDDETAYGTISEAIFPGIPASIKRTDHSNRYPVYFNRKMVTFTVHAINN